jgi:F0F1-type ATP synthase assembly protein I
MNKAADNKPTTSQHGGSNPSRQGWLIAGQLLDTSWRVALPILLLSYIGIQLDKHHGTRPLYTLIGLFVSLATSTYLVYRQIKILYPNFPEGDKK